MKSAHLFIFLFLSMASFGQDFSRLNTASATSVDALVNAKISSEKMVGATIALVKNGEIVYLKGYGYADKGLQIEATPNTTYRIASNSKMFTAMLALQLWEDGDLDITKDVRDYVSEFPIKSNTVTTENVLTNESGLESWTYHNTSVAAKYIMANPFTYKPVDVLEIFDTDPLSFTPGTQYQYSNKGFDVAAAVIERAGTGSFEDQLYARICDVADMPFFQMGVGGRMPYYNQAQGYKMVDGAAVADKGGSGSHDDVSHFGGGGGMVASARDIGHFITAFVNDDLFDKKTTRVKMGSNHDPNNSNSYGYGIGFGYRNGDTLLAHGGQTTWSRCVFFFSPENKNGIAVLSSNGSTNFDDLGLDLYDELNSVTILGSAYSNPVTRTLAAPTLSLPAHSTTISSKTVKLDWQSVNYADKYIYEFADNASFTSSTLDTAYFDEIYLNNLSLNQTYYWRVKAINTYMYNGTMGSWSSTRQFSTGSTHTSPITLPFTEDFENLHTFMLRPNENFISENGYSWSFETSNLLGRAKVGKWTVNTISGNGSASLETLDQGESNPAYSTTALVLTLDLSAYTANNNISINFDLIKHYGGTDAEDVIMIRGSNSDSWISLYPWHAYAGASVEVHEIRALLINSLLAANSQTVSNTFQLKFQNKGNRYIYGHGTDGFTIDNIEVKEESANIFTAGHSCCGYWDYSANWSYGTVPTKNDDVIIPSGTSKSLAIRTDAETKNLLILSGAEMNIGWSQDTGSVTVYGSLINNGSIYTNTGSDLILKGTNPQVLKNGSTIDKLKIENSNGVSLDGDVTVNNLSLVNGFLDIGSHDLTLSGTTTHGSSNSYIRLSSTGKVKATVGSGSTIFPVGRNPYLPVIISNGNGAEYSVGLSDNLYENPTNLQDIISQNSISETWSIQSSTTATNVSIQVGWDVGEETTGFTRASSVLGYWESGVSSAWQKGTLSGATGSNPYFQTVTMSTMSTNLYYFGVGSGGTALPVELTYFTAHWQTKGESAQLHWQTATETNNSHFEIQRSFDGIEFQTIGSVEGMGTTISSTDYEFTDPLETNNANIETIYYRLKQVDFNGEYEYSDVRMISSELETRSSFSLWPNPSSGDVFYVSEVGDYSILSMNGIIIKTFTRTDKFDISELENGTYMVRNKDGNHRIILIQ